MAYFVIFCSICHYEVYRQQLFYNAGSRNYINIGSILWEQGAYFGFYQCPQCDHHWKDTLQVYIEVPKQ